MLPWSLLLTVFVPEAAAQVVERPVAQLCYPSGLQVAVVRDARQPVVGVTLVVDGGAADDPVGREGTAHLLEHLLFRSHEGSGPSVSDRLTALGAWSNGFTLPDVTVYVAEAPSDALPGIVDAFADGLRAPLAGVDDDVVAQEAALLSSERWRYGGLRLVDHALLLPEGFLPPEVAPPGRGPERDPSVAAITRADLEASAARAYDPRRATLVVVGDVSAADVQGAVDQAFTVEERFEDASGARPATGTCAGRRRALEIAPLPPAERVLSVREAPLELPRLVTAWRLPGGYGPEDPLIQLASAIARRRWVERVTDGRSAVAEELSASCSWERGGRVSMLVCTADVPAHLSATRLVRRAREPRVGENPPSEAVVERALKASHVGLTLALDEVSPVAAGDTTWDAVSTHMTGSPRWFADALGTWSSARPADVLEQLERWLAPARARSVLLVPPGTDTSRLLDDEGAVLDVPADLLSAVGGRGDTRGRDTRPGEARLEARLSVPEVALPPVERLRVEAGPTVVVARRPGAHLSHVALSLPVGWARAEDPEAAAFGRELLRIDPRVLDAYDFADAALGADARLSLSLDDRDLVVRLDGGGDALGRQLEVVLALARTLQASSHAGVRQAEADRVRERAAEVAEDPWDRAARWRRARVLGADHPGTPWRVEAAARASLRTDGPLRAWARGVLRPDAATVYVVGDVSGEEVRTALVEAMGDWKGRGRLAVPATPPPARPEARAVQGFRAEAAPVVRVSLACPLPDAEGAETDVALELLWRRLWLGLRESSVGSYDPDVGLSGWGTLRWLQLDASVAPGRGEQAAIEMLEALREVASLRDEARVRDAARRRARAEVLGWVSGASVLDRFLEDGVDAHRAPAARRAALTRADAAGVRGVLEACVGHEAVSIVGPGVAEAPIPLPTQNAGERGKE